MGRGSGRSRAGWLAALLALLALSAGAPARADDFYRFIDARGVIHFTNAPADQRFRPIPRPANQLASGFYGLASFAPPTVDARRWDRLIVEAARRQELPPALVKAVIAAESSFDPRAVSPKGAAGLMQLMPATADMLGVDPLRAEQNVNGGVRYLRSLVERFGDVTHALAAYNAGPDSVERYGGIPPYPETRQYVRRVLAYYRLYHGEFRR
jgi:soluble lytic murein transglycosylase